MKDDIIDNEKLLNALSKMLDETIINADFQYKELQGGTLGDVYLIKGTASSFDGSKFPYEVVLKIQKKWERPGDPDSWRREYDLYASSLGNTFSDSLGWPKCYHSEISADEIRIWMEYADGISGGKLTINMLEQAAYELGSFQGKLCNQPELLQGIPNLSDPDFLEKDYNQWHNQNFSYEFLVSDECKLPKHVKQILKDNKDMLYTCKSIEYALLRSSKCRMPQHLKQMLIDIDNNRDNLFQEISRLPIVLCRRDFWIENIIYTNGKIRLIDWDTTGLGYLGEDIASLISDGVDYNYFEELCRRLIPAYYKGISEHIDISGISKNFVCEIILIKFGYRMLQGYVFAESDEDRDGVINNIQKIYDYFYGGKNNEFS